MFATTGREPLRIELFGDEVEQIRAFSPFTQRALRQVEEAASIRPPSAGASSSRSTSATTTTSDAPPVPDDLVPAFDRPPDFVWAARRGAGGLGGGGADAGRPRRGGRADPLPQGQPFTFDAQRPALAARGLSEAENELGGLLRQELDVVVTFPHRGEALRQQQLLRRVEARMLDPGEQRRAGLFFAVSPARRGFVWRELGIALLPDTQVFRKRPPRAAAAPGRALQSFSDLRTGDYVVHEDHGVAQLLGFETKEVAGVTRDYLLLAFRGDDRVYVPHEQIGKVSRYIGADSKAPALSKLGGKAWDNLKTRARAHLREMAGELLQLYAQRQTQPGIAYDVEHEWVEQLETEFPYRETEDQRAAIEAVKEDLEAPRPMDRLVCGDVGFGKTEVACARRSPSRSPASRC